MIGLPNNRINRSLSVTVDPKPAIKRLIFKRMAIKSTLKSQHNQSQATLSEHCHVYES